MTKGLKDKCDEILELEKKRILSNDEEEIYKLERQIEKKMVSITLANINNVNAIDNYLFPKLLKFQEEQE